MIDWFVVLTPLLLLPLALLLLFVGCGFDGVGTADPPKPPPPPPPPPPPGPGPGPPPGGPPPPPVVLADTRFQLNLAPDLQPPAGAVPRVWKVDVTWTLKKAGAVVGKIPSPPLHFEPKDPSRKSLQFGVDEWKQHIDMAPPLLKNADTVACTCEITLEDGTTSVATSAAPDAPLMQPSCQLYTLRFQPKVPTPFLVAPETASGC